MILVDSSYTYIDKYPGIAKIVTSSSEIQKILYLIKNYNYSVQPNIFGEEIVFCIPDWIYKIRDNISHTIDPLTGERRDWIATTTGKDMIRHLSCIDRSVSLWLDCCENSENNFFSLVHEDSLPREKAKDVLTNSLSYSIFIEVNKNEIEQIKWNKIVKLLP